MNSRSVITGAKMFFEPRFIMFYAYNNHICMYIWYKLVLLFGDYYVIVIKNTHHKHTHLSISN